MRSSASLQKGCFDGFACVAILVHSAGLPAWFGAGPEAPVARRLRVTLGMPIRMPPDTDDRPRERLLSRGVSALSDAELLAVILGSGVVGMNVVNVAQSLLFCHGGLSGVACASLHELRAQAGVGLARGAAVLAAIELGRRSVGERPARGRRIASASDIWTHLRARLAACPVEEFWAVALDVRHRVLWETCLARGSLTGVDVHPRDVFRPLIRGGAAAVIFCHNHPSGDPSPSQQDVDLTARLRDVGALCGIPVLDHVVVGVDGFVSIAQDRGLGFDPDARRSKRSHVSDVDSCADSQVES
jgi:DNA repair protein RadC